MHCTGRGPIRLKQLSAVCTGGLLPCLISHGAILLPEMTAEPCLICTHTYTCTHICTPTCTHTHTHTYTHTHTHTQFGGHWACDPLPLSVPGGSGPSQISASLCEEGGAGPPPLCPSLPAGPLLHCCTHGGQFHALMLPSIAELLIWALACTVSTVHVHSHLLRGNCLPLHFTSQVCTLHKPGWCNRILKTSWALFMCS